MTNPLNNLKQEAQNIRLSSSEKVTMRANIFSMADASKRASLARVRVASSYSWFSVRFAAPLALLLVVALGGSTAYAAQGALPGGILYPVKIYVNEQVQGALAVSDEAKVSFHTSIAETRLKEAQTLASQGKLDATTSAQIESNLDEHIAQADTIAATIAAKDPAAGIVASVNLDSLLAAQGSILASLGSGSSDEATKENSDVIAQTVLARGNGDSSGAVVVAIKTAGIAPSAEAVSLSVSQNATSDATIAPSEGVYAMSVMKTAAPSAITTAAQASSTQKIALQLQKNATSELSDAHQEFADTKTSLDATTTAKVTAQLADLDKSMQDGAAQVAAADYVTARTTFTDIIRQSIELSAFIDASKTYKKDFVRGGNSSGGDSASADASATVSGTEGTSSSARAGAGHQNNNTQNTPDQHGGPGQTTASASINVSATSSKPQSKEGSEGKGSVDTTIHTDGTPIQVHL